MIEEGTPIDMDYMLSDKRLRLGGEEELKQQEVIIEKKPTKFKDYIGQTKAKSILKGYIVGTKARKTQFPHLLIHGPAGCGKTTLAKIMATELNYPFIEIIASEVSSADELVNLIKDNDNALVFLDEVHGLKRDFVEPLYPLMEDFKYQGEDISPFTLIGATTEIGEIIKNRKPFYDRFILKQELEDYKPSHIQKIITNLNHKLYSDKILPENVLQLIAKNSRNTPRVGIGLLQSTVYLNGDVEKTLDSNNIICNGYTHTDLKTLNIIAKHNRGIGVQGIASFLGTSVDNYTYQIEPWLIRTNCILRTSKGRMISNYGLRVIKLLERYSKDMQRMFC
jgi:Holliday junction DNA helicase RuvB